MGSENPHVFNNIHRDIIGLNLHPILIVPVFLPIQAKKAPTQSFVSA
jgi:hypothetical protein